MPGRKRVSLRRHPERGHHDRPTIDAILDASPYCHLGFVVDGQPFVIPTIHARDGDTVYVHGSSVSRMLRTLRGGVPMCLTVTLLDGLVLARSRVQPLDELPLGGGARHGRGGDRRRREERRTAAVVEHVLEGRWDHVRWPTDQELKATSALALPLDEALAKIRTGPPKDDEEDLDYPVWAGVLPLRMVAGDPVPDPDLPASTPVPDHVADDGRVR